MADGAGGQAVQSLSEVPKKMRHFSWTLQSLCAGKAISGSTAETRQIEWLLDDTRRDAKTYANGVLPVCTKVVQVITDFSEKYEVLKFGEWKDKLSDIMKEMTGYIQLCAVVVKLHTDIKAEARVLLDKLEELAKGHDAPVLWSNVLTMLPGKLNEMKLNNPIRDGPVAALTSFIGGLEAIITFFGEIEENMSSWHKLWKTCEKKPKMTQFTFVKSGAASVMDQCRRFAAVIPGMKMDLEAIPEEGADLHYIDNWLAKKEAEVRREYEVSMSSYLEKLLEHFAYGANRKTTSLHDTVERSTRLFREMRRTMRALFDEDAFTGASDDLASLRVKIIRDDTLQTAKSYVKNTLPEHTRVIVATAEFFRQYDESSSLATWKATLPTVLRAASDCVQLCEGAITEHKAILHTLKKSEDRARTIGKELTDLTEKYDREIAALDADAAESTGWGVGLLFVPFAGAALLADAGNQRKKANEKRSECLRNRYAVATIDHAILPALKNFIGSLEWISGYFKSMEEELLSLNENGVSEVKRHRHYKKMMAEAAWVSSSCQEFLRSTPQIGNDILAIPDPKSLPLPPVLADYLRGFLK